MSAGIAWSKVKRKGGRFTPWSRPWAGIQVISHVCVFYAVTCFASVIQPEWLTGKGPRHILLVMLYWIDFGLSLACYIFVCSADTSYRECNGGPSRTTEYESRRCEECSPNITRLRVKHCQTCCKCTEEFDHHCRYLNVCIGGRTYRPWFCFVVGLLILMGVSGFAAIMAMLEPEEYELATLSSPLFYILVALQAFISCVSSIFLISLLGQHIYFIFEGITTLEYVKDQAAGFPALPPRGWREAVRKGECYACSDELSTIEVEDATEVWFCTVCQVDIGKAGVEFFTCDSCDNVNVCPLCRDVARDPGIPVVTYRVASLRRRADFQAGKMYSYYGSRMSSFSSQRGREPRSWRKTLVSVLAAAEGHTGEPARKLSICNPESAMLSRGDGGYDDSTSSEDSTP